MKAIIYKVTCLTNLHVGNGESNFDIIDNAVEKDSVTGLPTINSSGVKGALRQYFKEKNIKEEDITNIFGSEQKKSQGTGSIPGKIKFYQADLFARPARASQGDRTNYMVTSNEAISIFNQKVEIFGGEKINAERTVNNNIGVEDLTDLEVVRIGLIDDECTLIAKDCALRDLPLPVLARNQLEDGISKNLWYEQVVPHKSIFTFVVSSDYEQVLQCFSAILNEKTYIQFGGNASIGYGLCQVERIGGCNESR